MQYVATVVSLSVALSQLLGVQQPFALSEYRAVLSVIARIFIGVVGVDGLVTQEVMIYIVNDAVLIGALILASRRLRVRMPAGQLVRA